MASDGINIIPDVVGPVVVVNNEYIDEIKLLTHDSCKSPVFVAAAGASGDLAKGSYLLEITSVTEYGESLSETALTIAITAEGGGNIAGTIYKANNASKYRIYIDGEMQQEIKQLADNNTLFDITGLVSGADIPTSETATIHLSSDNYDNALVSATEEYYQYFRTSSININHKYGVIYLAASYVCLQIAAKYAHSSNKLINADSVDYKMRADDFRKMATEYRTKSVDIIGMGKKRGTVAVISTTRQALDEVGLY